ncbi:MAG: hypothetical protein KZQ77_09460 [Candidatus Thiodiazotropha sp. (ex Notomyrtea botanica)]|nr:hypothetical protein [Candidatus Thiodiazotropha sp. (ex Notomyrtea botanica)]
MTKLLFTFIASIILAGCSLLNTQPFSDTHKDQNSQLVLSDTKRNWQFFREMVDRRIEAELSRQRPEGGKESWNEFWLWLIDAQKTGREHASRYINYIIEARRAKGLPDIHGGI